MLFEISAQGLAILADSYRANYFGATMDLFEIVKVDQVKVEGPSGMAMVNARLVEGWKVINILLNHGGPVGDEGYSDPYAEYIIGLPAKALIPVDGLGRKFH